MDENIKFNEWIKRFEKETQNEILSIVNSNLQEYNTMCKREGINDCILNLECLEVSEILMLGIFNSEYYCIKYVDTDDRILTIISINIFDKNVKNVLTNLK